MNSGKFAVFLLSLSDQSLIACQAILDNLVRSGREQLKEEGHEMYDDVLEDIRIHFDGR